MLGEGKTMKISEILSKAKGMIERKWIKKAFTDHTGGYCALGALRIASGMSSVDDHSLPVTREAAAILGDIIRSHEEWSHCTGGSGSVWMFNDHYATTKEDVLALFTEAERRAKLTET
jgi:hypothetical protein